MHIAFRTFSGEDVTYPDAQEIMLAVAECLGMHPDRRNAVSSRRKPPGWPASTCPLTTPSGGAAPSRRGSGRHPSSCWRPAAVEPPIRWPRCIRCKTNSCLSSSDDGQHLGFTMPLCGTPMYMLTMCPPPPPPPPSPGGDRAGLQPGRREVLEDQEAPACSSASVVYGVSYRGEGGKEGGRLSMLGKAGRSFSF